MVQGQSREVIKTERKVIENCSLKQFPGRLLPCRDRNIISIVASNDWWTQSP